MTEQPDRSGVGSSELFGPGGLVRCLRDEALAVLSSAGCWRQRNGRRYLEASTSLWTACLFTPFAPVSAFIQPYAKTYDGERRARWFDRSKYWLLVFTATGEPAFVCRWNTDADLEEVDVHEGLTGDFSAHSVVEETPNAPAAAEPPRGHQYAMRLFAILDGGLEAPGETLAGIRASCSPFLIAST